MRATVLLANLFLAAAGLHLAAAQATSDVPPALAAVLFWQAELPRVLMAVTVGAGFGLAGAAMQEVTRNPLVSPTTLGTVTGAWLALLVATLIAPGFAAGFGPWICLLGGGAATAAVLMIAGPLRMHGVVVIVVGMSVNLFLGGLIVVLTLLSGEAARGLFIWGAGDLTQTGWDLAAWTAPQVAVAAAALLALTRPLAAMRLGQSAAAGRGVPTVLVSIAVLSLAVWLTAASVAAVGAIGFVGLVAPNIVRGLGVRSTAGRLLLGGLAGALALLVCDAVPVALSQWALDLIPTGAAAALIGAPALVLLALFRARAREQGRIAPVPGRARPPRLLWPALAGVAVAALGTAVGVGGSVDGPVWLLEPTYELDLLTLSLRWPSVVAAAGAGVAMATAGVVLQRLLRNPLASPDILGMTSGATLAVVCAVVFLDLRLTEVAVPAALLGALAVLILLTLVWRRRTTPPAMLILTGIALAALLDSLAQFAMARGGDEAYALLVWLTGATFLATGDRALLLLAVSLAVLAVVLLLRRWLTQLSLGDAVAAARGLEVERARAGVLLATSVATGTVVACVGPITFIGLVAPHAATLLGARRATEQLAAAALIGVTLVVTSELVGRLAGWPDQLPAGAVAAVVGGMYLISLTLGLLVRRRSAAW